MPTYECSRCGFSRKKKSTVKTHLKRLSPCTPHKADVDAQVVEVSPFRNNNNTATNINNTNITISINSADNVNEIVSGLQRLIIPANTTLTTNIPQRSFQRKPLNKALRTKVWRREQRATDSDGMDNVPCACCSERVSIYDYECGHLISVANGGSDTLDNLTVMCRTCNGSMGRTNFDEFRTAFLSGVNQELDDDTDSDD